jgi:hypothetical protein
MCIHTHTYIPEYINAYTNTYIHTYIHTYVYTYIHIQEATYKTDSLYSDSEL